VAQQTLAVYERVGPGIRSDPSTTERVGGER